MKHNIDPEGMMMNGTLYEHMWKVLGLPISEKNFSRIYFSNTGGQNARLDEDLMPATLSRLMHVFDALTGPHVLAELLHGSGATLWGCEACAKTQVVDWLRSGWG